jgi:hypothetical protein
MSILNIDPKSILRDLNSLDQETRRFLEKFGGSKNIVPPTFIQYDEKLANTKSSKQASEEKGKNLIQGSILCIVSFILGTSILFGQGDKKMVVLPFILGIGGGVLIYKSYNEKPIYNNSRQAENARRAKLENEHSQKTYFVDIVNHLNTDIEEYRQFLSLNPTSAEIIDYRDKKCLNIEDRQIFNLVLQKVQQKIQQDQEAKEAVKTLGSIVNIGFKVAKLRELHEISSELDEIGNSLTEAGEALTELGEALEESQR